MRIGTAMLKGHGPEQLELGIEDWGLGIGIGININECEGDVYYLLNQTNIQGAI